MPIKKTIKFDKTRDKYGRIVSLRPKKERIIESNLTTGERIALALSRSGIYVLLVGLLLLCLASWIVPAKADEFQLNVETEDPLYFGSWLRDKANWDMEFEVAKDLLPDGTDLDKLSYAVAMAETKNCKDVTNFTRRNNCHGIILSQGIANYESIEESHEHFKDIWTRLYGAYPDYRLAHRWTGGDRTNHWIVAVNQYYHE
jgi:hypothetical protein